MEEKTGEVSLRVHLENILLMEVAISKSRVQKQNRIQIQGKDRKIAFSLQQSGTWDLSKPEMNPGNHTWNQSSVKLSPPRVMPLHSWLLQNPVAGIKTLSLVLHPSCPQASVVDVAFPDWGSSEALALHQWKPLLIFVEAASSHPSFFFLVWDDKTRAAQRYTYTVDLFTG